MPPTRSQNSVSYRWGRLDETLSSLTRTLECLKTWMTDHEKKDDAYHLQIDKHIRESDCASAVATAALTNLEKEIGLLRDDYSIMTKDLEALRARLYWVLGIGACVSVIVVPIITLIVNHLMRAS
jgi:hypothetical protein